MMMKKIVIWFRLCHRLCHIRITYHNAFHKGAQTSFLDMLTKIPAATWRCCVDIGFVSIDLVGLQCTMYVWLDVCPSNMQIPLNKQDLM